jgi:hypothetical protein
MRVGHGTQQKCNLQANAEARNHLRRNLGLTGAPVS